MKAAKVEKIRKTLNEAKERGKNQVCRVYQLKPQNLSNHDGKQLGGLFLKTKWLYNYRIADVKNRLNDETWKLKRVDAKTPNSFEVREVEILSSQMIQGVTDRNGN